MRAYTFPNGFRVIYDKPKSKLPLTSILGFVNPLLRIYPLYG